MIEHISPDDQLWHQAMRVRRDQLIAAANELHSFTVKYLFQRYNLKDADSIEDDGTIVRDGTTCDLPLSV